MSEAGTFHARRPMTEAIRLITLALAAAALLAGCGGGDLSGDPDVPSGYKTFKGAGVTFAYPGDWQVAQRTDADGVPFVEITPPDKAKTPYGLVQLTIDPKAGERFDSLADQRRVAARSVADTKIDSDEAVDVEGAEKALRAKSTTPAGRGNDPVEVKSDSLDVLRSNGDVVVLVAAAPQRGGGGLDPEAVISSFRLEGS
jgi:hypothetical protein